MPTTTTLTPVCEILEAQTIRAHAAAVSLTLELSRYAGEPTDTLHLSVSGGCFNAVGTLTGEQEGWTAELTDAKAVRALGETLLALADRAETAGLLERE